MLKVNNWQKKKFKYKMKLEVYNMNMNKNKKILITWKHKLFKRKSK